MIPATGSEAGTACTFQVQVQINQSFVAKTLADLHQWSWYEWDDSLLFVFIVKFSTFFRPSTQNILVEIEEILVVAAQTSGDSIVKQHSNQIPVLAICAGE
ncbi:hypothetical protein OGAPHI_004253 [Ogataea philodendri]|uniref:Uncharacterized protein n=1 Tax=Ogataea philodendri TaxID=1378263 RepID=A0A9P8T590_9ASCO|nr:uncharacterized protein OGAPHI_004253 [Ogataea philodendri]KAH3666064.1 hypothetical protein OGAPHI_004253 [Ogataea philodendri]